MPNPFTEGSEASKYFVGRGSEQDRLARRLDGLVSGSPAHVHISGVFGTGKSTLIWKGLELASERRICADRIEVARQKTTTTSLVQLQTLLKDLLSRLREGQPESEIRQWGSLDDDWRRGKNSTQFKFCSATDLDPESFGHDLRLIARTADQLGYSGLAVFIDEAQWLRADALLSLRSALAASTGIIAIVATRLYGASPTIEAAARDHFTQAADDSLNRMFSTIIPIGVFQGNEARQCILKRLELDDADIEFGDAIIEDIAQITGGLPFEVIGLSRELYELVEERALAAASAELLLSACRAMYPAEWTEVAALLDSTSPAEAEALCALANHPAEGSALELVKKVRADVSSSEAESEATQWSGMLLRFAERHPEWCDVNGDEVVIVKPIVSYLLRERLSQAEEMN